MGKRRGDVVSKLDDDCIGHVPMWKGMSLSNLLVISCGHVTGKKHLGGYEVGGTRTCLPICQDNKD